MSNAYTVTTIYSGDGAPSEKVIAICTTRETAEAKVERDMRAAVFRHGQPVNDDWSYRVDEYPLCTTPNEAHASKVNEGKVIQYEL